MKDELELQIARLESNLTDFKAFQAERHLKSPEHADELSDILERANRELEKALF